MKQLILDQAEHEMMAQGQFLSLYFEDWKGEHEQIDDVCVMGIEIT